MVPSVSSNAVRTTIHWLIAKKSIRCYKNVRQVINNKNNMKELCITVLNVIKFINISIIYVFFLLNSHVTFLSVSFSHQFEVYSTHLHAAWIKSWLKNQLKKQAMIKKQKKGSTFFSGLVFCIQDSSYLANIRHPHLILHNYIWPTT